MENTIQLHDKKFRIMIPAEQIDKAVDAVAQRINADYAGKETPLFLGILNGSFMFMSDLIKKIEFQNELSFVKLASYDGTCSTGCVKSLIGLNNPIEGRHVISAMPIHFILMGRIKNSSTCCSGHIHA